MTNARAVAKCAAAAALFGASAPLAARLTDDMGSFTLAGLLYLGAAVAVSPLVVARPPKRLALRQSAVGLAAAVVLGGTVAPVLLVIGLGLVPAATASLLLNLEVVFTAAAAASFFREHLGGRMIAGSALVLAGAVVLGASGAPDLRWGGLLIAGACACWAIDNNITTVLEELAPAQITFAKGVVAGSANLLIGLVTGTAPAAAALLWALAIGALGYGVSITLWVSGARGLGAARGQLVFATAPFVGAVVAWVVLGDDPSWREGVAFGAALAGVALVSRSSHSHAHTHAALVHEHLHVPDLAHRHPHRG